MFYEKYIQNVPMSSGWASESDLASSKGCICGSWEHVPDEGGVVLNNRQGRVIVDGGDECRHVLISGATGTGKSRLIIMPSILHSLRARNKRSMVIFDVKGEIQRTTRYIAEKEGYRIRNIDFRTPDNSDGWNPLARANQLHRSGNKENQKKAHQIFENVNASIFTDGAATRVDPFWRTVTGNAFRGTGTLLWELDRDVSIQAISKLMNTIPPDKDDDDSCLLFQLANQHSATAHRLLQGIRSGSNQTRGNLLASYHGYMAPLTARDDILAMISKGDSVDFQRMGTEPTVLYITLPDDTYALGPIQGMLLTQLIQELNECANAAGGRLPICTDIYIDELCNIKPAMQELETQITIGRSRGIRYILAIQSYAQLCNTYGVSAETIAANAATWIILNIAKDESFRNKISQLCGRNALDEPLITPPKLALLEYGQAIIIRDYCPPYFSQLEDLSTVIRRIEDHDSKQHADFHRHVS